MEIIKYYGSDTDCKEFINHDSEPLMAVIAHDGSHAVVSQTYFIGAYWCIMV